MGLGDLFKAKENEQLKINVAALNNRIAELEAMLTPEMRDSILLQEKIRSQQETLDGIQAECEKAKGDQEKARKKSKDELAEIKKQIKDAKKELVETNEAVLLQSFGLYEPKYAFAESSEYKERLAEERMFQKTLVQAGDAVTGATSWTVNGSAAQGKKMVKDTQKLLLRAFNCECDDIIEHVKFNNIEASEKRIRTASSTISKLGTIMSISIAPLYVESKVSELHLAHEFQVKKQEEKDRLKQLRAEERERAKLEKEIEEARKKIEKEQKHFSNALAKLNQQIAAAAPDELAALEEKKSELEGKLGELGESIAQIDYRAANQKAGYVYIISNVGAFGEGVYKIGMTRRLEPMDRVDELGDASVPFDFDVHALIFSEDAPALETALHHAFEDRKLNMVNTRREFFRVSLDEIKQVVKDNFDKTVEFVDIPPAEQFRTSELMRASAK